MYRSRASNTMGNTGAPCYTWFIFAYLIISTDLFLIVSECPSTRSTVRFCMNYCVNDRLLGFGIRIMVARHVHGFTCGLSPSPINNYKRYSAVGHWLAPFSPLWFCVGARWWGNKEKWLSPAATHKFMGQFVMRMRFANVLCHIRERILRWKRQSSQQTNEWGFRTDRFFDGHKWLQPNLAFNDVGGAHRLFVVTRRNQTKHKTMMSRITIGRNACGFTFYVFN